MAKKFTTVVDRFSINGVESDGEDSMLDETNVNGDWYFNESTKIFSYMGSIHSY